MSRSDAGGQRSLFELWTGFAGGGAAAAVLDVAPEAAPTVPSVPLLEPLLPQQHPLRPLNPLRPLRPLRVSVLGSGSGGNAVVVESGSCRIMIDAGFSSRELARRLALVGVEPASLSAVVLTHEHIDHCRGIARFARRHRLAVFATAGTLGALRAGALDDATASRATVLRSGEPCQVGDFQIEPFLVPHDAREPIGAVIEDGAGRRLGLVADCGTHSHLAWARLRELDLLLMETNHDLDMLRNGPYPWPLKQRVAGRQGHLSNREAADGLPELLCDRLRWVVLYHLSRTNNLPALAAATIAETLRREGCSARVEVTGQFEPTPWLEVG